MKAIVVVLIVLSACGGQEIDRVVETTIIQASSSSGSTSATSVGSNSSSGSSTTTATAAHDAGPVCLTVITTLQNGAQCWQGGSWTSQWNLCHPCYDGGICECVGPYCGTVSGDLQPDQWACGAT